VIYAPFAWLITGVDFGPQYLKFELTPFAITDIALSKMGCDLVLFSIMVSYINVKLFFIVLI
jgi:hypothetical protein